MKNYASVFDREESRHFIKGFNYAFDRDFRKAKLNIKQANGRKKAIVYCAPKEAKTEVDRESALKPKIASKKQVLLAIMKNQLEDAKSKKPKFEKKKKISCFITITIMAYLILIALVLVCGQFGLNIEIFTKIFNFVVDNITLLTGAGILANMPAFAAFIKYTNILKDIEKNEFFEMNDKTLNKIKEDPMYLLGATKKVENKISQVPNDEDVFDYNTINGYSLETLKELASRILSMENINIQLKSSSNQIQYKKLKPKEQQDN